MNKILLFSSLANSLLVKIVSGNKLWKLSYLQFIIGCLFVSKNFSQNLYNNNFSNLSLQTYSNSASSVQYTTTTPAFSLINDGYGNNIGSTNNPNKPFNAPDLKKVGWAIVFNELENDTFLVSTSWLDTTLVAADRWLITPPISNITANTVLTWLAKSPDANFKESYAVYGTTKTGALTNTDFSVGDQLFAIANGENANWTRRSLNLSNFAGQTLRLAFKNNSTDKYQLWVDDIQVITLPNSIDASVGSINSQKYILTNTNQIVATTITNLSATTINSITLNYQIGNSTIQSEQITFTEPLAYKQTSPLNFGLPYAISTAGNYKLKVWLSSVNATIDQNQANDTSFIYVSVQSSKPKKNVLVEQFVSAFDGECTDAQEKTMALQNDSVIIVNIHTSDSLKENNSTGAIVAYKKSTATAMFDRTYFPSIESVSATRPYYDSLLSKQLVKVSPASVSIINKSYNTTTRELSFSVKADFIGNVKGDLRLNAYLIENSVHGPTQDNSLNGYNQLNSYYNIPWSPYYQTGNYYTSAASILTPYQFKHQNVLVHSFDGSFGNAGTIPTNGGTQGQSYTKTFSLTLPTSTTGTNKYNADNLYIVGFLAEYNLDVTNRAILNATKEKITSNTQTLWLHENSNTSFFSFYPNPTQGRLYFNNSSPEKTLEIRITDVTGRCVYIANLNDVGNNFMLDVSELKDGAYFVTIVGNGSYKTEKLVIQKN